MPRVDAAIPETSTAFAAVEGTGNAKHETCTVACELRHHGVGLPHVLRYRVESAKVCLCPVTGVELAFKVGSGCDLGFEGAELRDVSADVGVLARLLARTVDAVAGLGSVERKVGVELGGKYEDVAEEFGAGGQALPVPASSHLLAFDLLVNGSKPHLPSRAVEGGKVGWRARYSGCHHRCIGRRTRAKAVHGGALGCHELGCVLSIAVVGAEHGENSAISSAESAKGLEGEGCDAVGHGLRRYLRRWCGRRRRRWCVIAKDVCDGVNGIVGRDVDV